ncbi:uncharacterized protein PHACADRAFT_262761 [Phanerochaete carnosa HHB-10118-sp]|uniref:H-type lectin domain-containing protein n=1 Tax=Phanerochaete carnosa (strain HHB-10118-sp) TaxID=650164 RepID=K5WKV5_PHACS|nr:uncharacterized protein PHACADRAFT_262761 [Phanerochaete carnosa HHB-10118-sp]EKM50882.1 hypothetical protein PHACADRAFT_262761 [Phanerochaete carnosa HHB-10118-sp]
MHNLNTSAENTKQPAEHTVNPTEPIPWLDCGKFSTNDVRLWSEPEPLTVGEVRFKVPSCYPRAVLLGLSNICMNNVRIRAEVRSIADDRAIVNMVAWGDTTHWETACSWLSIPLDDPDIQYGTYSNKEDRSDAQSQQLTSRQIAFARPYASPPKVVAWLNAVDCGAGRNAQVSVYADAVASDGFTIHTWSDSLPFSAGASWIAYSAGRTDVRSGTFEIKDVRPPDMPRHKNRGRVSWGAPRMAKPPRVFTALRMFHFDGGKIVRLASSQSEITTTGMTWNMDSWDETIFYQAGQVFVAFDDECADSES